MARETGTSASTCGKRNKESDGTFTTRISKVARSSVLFHLLRQSAKQNRINIVLCYRCGHASNNQQRLSTVDTYSISRYYYGLSRGKFVTLSRSCANPQPRAFRTFRRHSSWGNILYSFLPRLFTDRLCAPHEDIPQLSPCTSSVEIL